MSEKSEKPNIEPHDAHVSPVEFETEMLHILKGASICTEEGRVVLTKKAVDYIVNTLKGKGYARGCHIFDEFYHKVHQGPMKILNPKPVNFPSRIAQAALATDRVRARNAKDKE